MYWPAVHLSILSVRSLLLGSPLSRSVFFLSVSYTRRLSTLLPFPRGVATSQIHLSSLYPVPPTPSTFQGLLVAEVSCMSLLVIGVSLSPLLALSYIEVVPRAPVSPLLPVLVEVPLESTMAGLLTAPLELESASALYPCRAA